MRKNIPAAARSTSASVSSDALIFVYMRIFVSLCRDEYVTRYCFEFTSV